MKMMLNRCLVAAAVAFGVAGGAAAADVKVGVNVALSGPNSSLGIPYSKGMQAARAYKGEIGGHKVEMILLDDNSDPTVAARNAKKLVGEEHVDVLMGSSGVPEPPVITASGFRARIFRICPVTDWSARA